MKSTPMQKVIDLLEGLKQQVEAEGKSEATIYDGFACFCKDQTKKKSDSIIKGKDNIDTLSATIGKKTAEKVEKTAELADTTDKLQTAEVNLQEHNTQCQKDKEAYEAKDADLTKAISSLDNALSSLKASKPSFLQGPLEKTVAMAEAMKLLPPSKQPLVDSFLQDATKVDPSSPEYKFKSQGIIDVMEKLHVDFTGEKKTADDEESKRKKVCSTKKAKIEAIIVAHKAAIKKLKSEIDDLKKLIATTRSDLVLAEGVLKDDQLYLKDLTARCETRAKDWDQRSKLRNGELTALTGALTILRDQKIDGKTVSDLDKSANKRALAQISARPAANTSVKEAKAHDKASLGLTFVQESSSTVETGRIFLGRTRVGLSSQEKQDKAVTLLAEAGRRLHSTALSALAFRASADPFEKVKTLIQKLVERLLAEATAEATKKGFCDEQLGKARTERDFRLEETNKLSWDVLAPLEAKEDALTNEIAELTADLKDLEKAKKENIDERAKTKKANMLTIKEAKAGLGAVTEALTILQVFYKDAAKETVLMQASPVDEDTAGAGFAGAYTGKQEESTGILGMLEVIKSDFERTIRVTTDDEAQDLEDFIKLDRSLRTDIGGKETKKKLDEEDLVTTKDAIKSNMDDLATAQSLLDKQLQVLEGLKPTCIDTGMSYDERKAKREEEIAALKKALTILAPPA